MMEPHGARFLIRQHLEIIEALDSDPRATLQTSPQFAAAAGAMAMRQLQDIFPRLVVDVSESTGFALQCIRAGCIWLYTPDPSEELTGFAEANGCSMVMAADELHIPPYPISVYKD